MQLVPAWKLMSRDPTTGMSSLLQSEMRIQRFPDCKLHLLASLNNELLSLSYVGLTRNAIIFCITFKVMFITIHCIPEAIPG